MKELSIEEKAKAYDETIEKLRNFYRDYDTVSRLIDVKEELTNLIPELKESEDERIRKYMIKYFEANKDELSKGFRWNGITVEECIAWLEKQGKKGVNGNEREIPIPEPPLTIKRAKEVMGIKQNDAWSEEDEIGLADAMWAIEKARTIAKDENDMGNLWCAERWLKSLKERYTWKPSDEQMNALNYVVNLMASSERPTENDLYYNVFKDLREQLKKLKS